jgi:hypothetical protein
VSQPYARGKRIPAPGKIDASLKEFWVENPWDIVARGENLSSYERNRAYLNVPDARTGRNFLEISALTGADSDGDGRSVVAADFRNTGQLDLVVRQAGGGAFQLYENRFPRRHFLKVSLRGTRSNRLGIGARLVAHVRGQPLVREVYPANTYRSQAPTVVHFGLGDAERVERLEVRWPSGLVQEFADLAGDRHVVLEEGSAAVETVVPGQTIRP